MRKCYKENKRTGGWVVMWVEKDCLQHCTQFYSLEVQGRNVFSNPPSPPLLPILLLNIWKDPWLSASPFHSPQKWWWAGGTWKETSWNCLIDILVGAGHQLPVLTSRGQIAAGWYRASCGGRSLSEPTSQKPDKWEMEKKEKVHFSRIVLLASIAMQLDFKFHHFLNRNLIVLVRTEQKSNRFGSEYITKKLGPTLQIPKTIFSSS